MENICLYNCRTENGQKLQGCYPPSGLNQYTESDLGRVVDEPLTINGKCNKYQVIKCKWPSCI